MKRGRGIQNNLSVIYVSVIEGGGGRRGDRKNISVIYVSVIERGRGEQKYLSVIYVSVIGGGEGGGVKTYCGIVRNFNLCEIPKPNPTKCKPSLTMSNQVKPNLAKKNQVKPNK